MTYSRRTPQQRLLLCSLLGAAADDQSTKSRSAEAVGETVEEGQIPHCRRRGSRGQIPRGHEGKETEGCRMIPWGEELGVEILVESVFV